MRSVARALASRQHLAAQRAQLRRPGMANERMPTIVKYFCESMHPFCEIQRAIFLIQLPAGTEDALRYLPKVIQQSRALRPQFIWLAIMSVTFW